MRTLHIGLRISDRTASIDFYALLGYEVVGEVVDTPIGHLTMLKLPDDEFVTLEFVHDPSTAFDGGTSLSHLVVQVGSIDDAVARLGDAGAAVGPVDSPQPEMRVAMLSDPDGYMIELVQWPPHHPVGMTADDFTTTEKENR